MENLYGITITNKYDLFLGDQDPYEILQVQEQLKAVRKSEKAKKNVAGNDKDSKSAKNKQIKADVVSQEPKIEKVESTPSPPKKDEKPRRVAKPVKAEDGTQPEAKQKEKQSIKSSSTPQRSKEDAFSQPSDFGNQTEFGHFEVRQSDRGGNRERRTRDGFGDRQERTFGNRDRGEAREGRTEGRERSDRGFGRERRPRGRYFGRPPRRGGFSDDRQRSGTSGDDQERGLFTEGDQGASGFVDRRGYSDHSGEKGGFSDHHDRKGSDDHERRGGGFEEEGGFDEERHYEDRQDRGNFERRTYESRRGGFGERRSYDDRVDRGGFGGERKRGERRGGGFGEQTDNQSFGHWSEKPGDGGEDREMRRGRGGGYTRRGRGRGRPGFGRREFDRRGGGSDQSGGRTGEKREGGGSHNWGTTMDDLEGQTENQVVSEGGTWGEQAEAAENQEASASGSAKPADEKEEEGAAAEEATEEEPKVMTLDEWKALQAAKRVKPEYNIRKPGEGCSNDPQWKKMVALTRKNPKEQSEDDEEEEYEEDKHAKSKTVLPIEITFTDNPRRGGRGGRRGGGGGSGRGGGGRGYPAEGGYRSDLRKSPSRRGDRESGGGRRGARERAPNVADEHDFPSLDKAVPVQ